MVTGRHSNVTLLDYGAIAGISGAGKIFQHGGQAWCVTQPFPAGGVEGTV